MHKNPQFIAARKEVDRIVDALGMPVDKGIKEAVAAFRASGFQTTASCEGHMDRGLSHPWIDFGIQKPAVTESSANAPKQVEALSKVLTEYSEKYPDAYVYAMISNEKPPFRYYATKKKKKYVVRDLNSEELPKGEIAILKAQLEKVKSLLEEYYAKNPTPYPAVLTMDISRDKSFRLQPINVESNPFLKGKQKGRAIEGQRAAMLAFARFVFDSR